MQAFAYPELLKNHTAVIKPSQIHSITNTPSNKVLSILHPQFVNFLVVFVIALLKILNGFKLYVLTT